MTSKLFNNHLYYHNISNSKKYNNQNKITKNKTYNQNKTNLKKINNKNDEIFHSN